MWGGKQEVKSQTSLSSYSFDFHWCFLLAEPNWRQGDRQPIHAVHTAQTSWSVSKMEKHGEQIWRAKPKISSNAPSAGTQHTAITIYIRVLLTLM